MTVRRFQPEDAEAVSALVIRTLREVNSRDYTPEAIEAVVRRSQPRDILQRADWTHTYVVCEGARIVGCGAIGPYWESLEESSLFTVFVHPEFQGRGIGRRIIETLEGDSYALRAKRIEIPASITAKDFYLKMGYRLKDGVTEPDEEGLYRMEKCRSIPGNQSYR